jgi:hypothetical protein
MSASFKLTLDDLKERLRVLKTIPEDSIVENFEKVEQALRAEVDEIIESVAVRESDGRLGIYPKDVPRTKARMLVRSIFSTIEGIVYSMKQLAISASRIEGTLTFPELILCREKSAHITDKGEAKVQSAKIQFLNNFRFSFGILAKALQLSFKLDTNCVGWNRLVVSAKIRDRLAHPKRPSDLELSDEEIGGVIEAYQWFNKQVETLVVMWQTNIEKSGSYISAMSERLEAGLAARNRAASGIRSDSTDVQNPSVASDSAAEPKSEAE